MLEAGNFVIYKPTNELGRIKSVNTTTAWVVFKCAGKWEQYELYTGAACSLETLEFVETRLVNIIIRSIGNNQVELPHVTRERKAFAKVAMFAAGIGPDNYSSADVINGLCNIITDEVGADYIPEAVAGITTNEIADMFSHDKVKPTQRTIDFRTNTGLHYTSI